MSEDELREEIRELRAEIVRLKARAVEDKHFADKRLKAAVEEAQGPTVTALQVQIANLEAHIVEEGAIIDRMCVYLRERNADPDSLALGDCDD